MGKLFQNPMLNYMGSGIFYFHAKLPQVVLRVLVQQLHIAVKIQHTEKRIACYELAVCIKCFKEEIQRSLQGIQGIGH